MLVVTSSGPYACDDCGRVFSSAQVAAAMSAVATVNDRCLVSQCDSNHQIGCNEAAEREGDSPCICSDASPGLTRAAKAARSNTGLSIDDRQEMRRRSDLLENIVGVVGTVTDTRALARIRELIVGGDCGTSKRLTTQALTYGDLLAALYDLAPEQLTQNVTIVDPLTGSEFFGDIELATINKSDVLDAGHYVLRVRDSVVGDHLFLG